MKIAVCDDDAAELGQMISLLEAYRRERRACVTYASFHSAAELLSAAKNGGYDLYLLDVMMPGISGMEAARDIRGMDQQTNIVFLTSSPEFAVESYRYRAHHYLLKPVGAQQLFEILDTLRANMRRPSPGILVKTRGGLARICFDRISHVEVVNKWVYFHLTDGAVKAVTAPLVEFEKILLARPEFARVHRSYIVNLWQVSELTANEIVTLQGERVPVSRQNYARVRAAFVEQAFARRAGSL